MSNKTEIPGMAWSGAEGVTKRMQQIKRKLRTLTHKTTTMWHMACCIFALSCPDPAPSAAYIAMHGADVEFENDDLEKQLRRWYATEDANKNLHNTLDPKTTVARRRHTTAVKFLKEWKLHKWVETTNLEKALAPCSSLMCQLGGPPGIEPAAIPFVVGSTCKHKSKLQWCRRWRRRWNVQLGKFCAGERLEPHVAHAKVHDNVWLKNPPRENHKSNPRRKTVPKKRSTFWPHFRGRSSISCVRGYQKNGPLFRDPSVACFHVRGDRSVALVQFFARPDTGQQKTVACEHGRNECSDVSCDASRQCRLRGQIRKTYAKISDHECNTGANERIHESGLLCLR